MLFSDLIYGQSELKLEISDSLISNQKYNLNALFVNYSSFLQDGPYVPNAIDFHQSSTDVGFNFSKFSNNSKNQTEIELASSVKNRRFSRKIGENPFEYVNAYNLQLRGNYLNRNYYSSNKYIEFDVKGNIGSNYNETVRDPNEFTQLGKFWYNGNASFRLGTGRINNIDHVANAKYLVNELYKRGLVKASINAEDIILISDILLHEQQQRNIDSTSIEIVGTLLGISTLENEINKEFIREMVRKYKFFDGGFNRSQGKRSSFGINVGSENYIVQQAITGIHSSYDDLSLILDYKLESVRPIGLKTQFAYGYGVSSALNFLSERSKTYFMATQTVFSSARLDYFMSPKSVVTLGIDGGVLYKYYSSDRDRNRMDGKVYMGYKQYIGNRFSFELRLEAGTNNNQLLDLGFTRSVNRASANVKYRF